MCADIDISASRYINTFTITLKATDDMILK